MPRTKTEAVTPLQLETLAALRDFTERHGYPPTLQELADCFGIRPLSCRDRIGQLIRKGALARAAGKSRGVTITPAGHALLATGNPRRRSAAFSGATGRPGAARTRQRILLAAKTLFGQKGPDAVGLRAVAAAAGVTVQVVAYHFGSKKNLKVQAMLHALAHDIPYDALFAPGETKKTLTPQGLADALAAMMMRFCAEVNNPAFVPYARLIAYGLLGDDTGLQRLLQQHLERLFEARFLAVLARGGVTLAPGPQIMFPINYIWSQVLFYACGREVILLDLKRRTLPEGFTDMVGLSVADTLCRMFDLPAPAAPTPRPSPSCSTI